MIKKEILQSEFDKCVILYLKKYYLGFKLLYRDYEGLNIGKTLSTGTNKNNLSEQALYIE